ncbi:hypothetical protein CFN78_13965 [Amycolatopsis antarctica]|uniref:PE domain-containing protein n=1 Tax=Amycolatopsis antarctica TaxID=1854586 RepID=A0A263D2M0_9PSEU|nr:hypothetical protein [Amycolatopsis antarctica]OZM72724.1 hypothetical protein CFN78_13965 [Amycolatopsis antarctica]
MLDAGAQAGGGAIDRLPFMPDVPDMWIGDAAKGLGGAAALAGNVAGDVAGSKGGGGFQFAPDQIDAVIAKWEDLLNQLRDDEAEVRIVRDVRPPGNEFASGDFADAGRKSGETLGDQNQRMIDYVTRYIEALKTAKSGVQATEENAQADVVAAAGDQ